MAIVTLDAKGMRCPGPMLRMTTMLLQQKVAVGDTLHVIADCPEFEEQVRAWCQRQRKTLILVREVAPGTKEADVRI